jgi:hypothetical protein
MSEWTFPQKIGPIGRVDFDRFLDQDAVPNLLACRVDLRGTVTPRADRTRLLPENGLRGAAC